MKTCSKCKTLKSLDQFYAKKSECKTCGNERVRMCRQRKAAAPEVQVATDYERLRAKVIQHLDAAPRDAGLVDLVSRLTAELIAFVAAPAPAPVQVEPVAAPAPVPVVAPAAPGPKAPDSLEADKLDQEEMYLLINETDHEYVTGILGKEVGDFIKQRPGFARAQVSTMNQGKINDLYNKKYKQVYYNPPLPAPVAEAPIAEPPVLPAAPAPKPAQQWCSTVEELDPDCDGYLCASGQDFWILNTEETTSLLSQRECKFLPTIHPRTRQLITALKAKPDVRVLNKESWVDPDFEKISGAAQYILVEPSAKRVSLIPGKVLKKLFAEPDRPTALKYDDAGKAYLEKYHSLGYEMPAAS